MIKQSITYDDIDGNSKTEEFWFQITKAEFTKKAIAEGGEAYQNKLRKLASITEDEMANGAGKQIMATFEDILGDSVGLREGQLFIKNEEIRKHFMYSGAYDSFFLELIQSPDSGATFIRNIMPKDAQAEIAKAMRDRGIEVPDEVEPKVELISPVKAIQTANADAPGKDDEPKWLQETRYPTPKELMGMGTEETRLAMKMKLEKAFG